MTPSAFLRAAALQEEIKSLPPVPEINARTYVELGRAGGLLNQLTRHMNQGGRATGDEIIGALTGLAQVVKKLRGEVLGA